MRCSPSEPRDWIVPPSDLPPRLQLDSFFHQARAPLPRRIITTGLFRILRELLLDSDCLSILVRENIRAEEEHRLLRVLDVPLVLPLRPIGIVQRRTAQSSDPAPHFIAMLRGMADGESSGERAWPMA